MALALSPKAEARRAPGDAMARLVLLACVPTALLAGLVGGLLRAGVAMPLPTGAEWPARAVLLHAALMVGAFTGTLIGIERAVAMRRAWAWLAPLASALAAPALLLLERDAAGRALLLGASTAFIGVNVGVVRRQGAPDTWLLLAGAFAWFAGNLLFALGRDATSVLPWWFAFLVATIAAERLEMTRLMRRRPAAQPLFVAVLVAMAAGAAASGAWPGLGGLLYGGSLVLLAAWLFAFDIARRTLRAGGLPRYMAVCLLGGYAWLMVAGVAWMGTAVGVPARDTALHALGLGFVVSMMFGHAPVILPAITGVKVLFGSLFYVPLAVLHASLAYRLGVGWADPVARSQGSLLNVLAIALFAGTVAGAALAWRRRFAAEHSPVRTP